MSWISDNFENALDNYQEKLSWMIDELILLPYITEDDFKKIPGLLEG